MNLILPRHFRSLKMIVVFPLTSEVTELKTSHSEINFIAVYFQVMPYYFTASRICSLRKRSRQGLGPTTSSTSHTLKPDLRIKKAEMAEQRNF